MHLRVVGLNRRIVSVTESGTTQAFTLTSNNGMGVSLPRNNRALAFLRDKIPSSDAGT